MKYFILSGNIISNSKSLEITNRAFRYGDGLFETMFFALNKTQNFIQHWNRLETSMNMLKMKPHSKLNIVNIENEIHELICLNKIKTSARVRLEVYRKEGGLYFPENFDSDYILEVEPLNCKNYELNEIGLTIGISENIIKYKSNFTQIKTTSKLEMIMASIEAKEKGWHDAILLNENNNIAEATSSNIFIFSNNTLITPPLNDNLLNGIMRKNILKIAQKENINCIENSIKEIDLLNAKEVFLTNSIKGIQWIKNYKNTYYSNDISKILIDKLNTNLETN